MCGVIDQLERELERLYQDNSRGDPWQAANAPVWRVA